MLKKGQKKSSTRLCDRVIVRKTIKNKCHDYVKKPKAFSRGRIISELTLILVRRALTESMLELIFGHCPQTLTIRVVKKLYPRNTEHIGDNLQCDNNVCTLNTSDKMSYWKIKSMHVGVKLLDQHGWTCDRDITQWLPTPTVNDIGLVSVNEVRQDDLAFRMNVSSRKVLLESLSGILIMKPNMWWSRIGGSGCPRTKRVLGRSRLAFRCHRHRLTQIEREGERERDNQKSPKIVQI